MSNTSRISSGPKYPRFRSDALPFLSNFCYSDNYRAPSVGGIAIGTNAWIRNLTKRGDILDFTFLTSAATGGNAYQHTGNWLVPIGDFGTKAYFSINNANVAIVEQPLAGINIKSDTFAVEGGLNQTLVESLKRRFPVGAGVGFKDNETNILGESFSFIPRLPSGKNQVSVVRINQEYIERWERLVWAFRSTFSVGLNAFGSTIQNNHLNPDSEYFAWLGQSRSTTPRIATTTSVAAIIKAMPSIWMILRFIGLFVCTLPPHAPLLC